MPQPGSVWFHVVTFLMAVAFVSGAVGLGFGLHLLLESGW